MGFEAITGPNGPGSWTAYTPTLTSSTGAFTTTSASGRYTVIGKVVLVSVSISIVSVGTGTFPMFTLPVSPLSLADVVFYGSEQGITAKAVNGRTSGAGTIIVTFYDNTNPAASGALFKLTGVYEAA